MTFHVQFGLPKRMAAACISLSLMLSSVKVTPALACLARQPTPSHLNPFSEQALQPGLVGAFHTVKAIAESIINLISPHRIPVIVEPTDVQDADKLNGAAGTDGATGFDDNRVASEFLQRVSIDYDEALRTFSKSKVFAIGNNEAKVFDVRFSGARRIMVIYDEEGNIETVTLSQGTFMVNLDHFRETFVEVPDQYRAAIIEKLGPEAAFSHVAVPIPRSSVLMPFAYRRSGPVSELILRNPVLEALFAAARNTPVSLNPRGPKIFLAGRSVGAQLVGNMIFISKEDRRHSEENDLAHELAHVLWKYVLTDEQKRTWLSYIASDDRLRIIFQSFVDPYGASETRRADEVFAYIIGTLADPFEWEVMGIHGYEAQSLDLSKVASLVPQLRDGLTAMLKHLEEKKKIGVRLEDMIQKSKPSARSKLIFAPGVPQTLEPRNAEPIEGIGVRTGAPTLPFSPAHWVPLYFLSFWNHNELMAKLHEERLRLLRIGLPMIGWSELRLMDQQIHNFTEQRFELTASMAKMSFDNMIATRGLGNRSSLLSQIFSRIFRRNTHQAVLLQTS